MRGTLGVSIVIPTLNEVGALPSLINALDRMLSANRDLNVTELVFVDDGSFDGTLNFISSLRQKATGYSVVVLSRTGVGGSGSAELEGIQKASNELVLKMDGDGQHSVDFVPALMREVTDDVSIVIASRYMRDSENRWPPIRGLISRVATSAAHVFVPESRRIRDPLSGFYIVRRQLAEHLDPQRCRYKAVLCMIAGNVAVQFREVPFVMLDRKVGKSKIVGTSLDYIVNFSIELLRYSKMAANRRHSRAPTSRPVSTAEKLG